MLYVIRGHISGREWGILVYILKAYRVLRNVTEQTFSLVVITVHASRAQIFHIRYNYSASLPISTPLPQYTRPEPSTSIYYKTDNSKMNGQSVAYNHRVGWMLAFSLTTKALLIPV